MLWFLSQHGPGKSKGSCRPMRNWQFAQPELPGEVKNPFIFQVLVILVTGAILVFGSWGSKQMKVEFDPMNLTPKDSYMRMFKGGIAFFKKQLLRAKVFLSKTAKIMPLIIRIMQCNEMFLINDTECIIERPRRRTRSCGPLQAPGVRPSGQGSCGTTSKTLSGWSIWPRSWTGWRMSMTSSDVS